MIQVFNTLSRRKEEFIPQNPNRVTLYTCGPTVYDFAHIGNLRTFIAEDMIRRTLEYAGYNVLHVMNITDIDDKTIRRAQEEGIPLKEYTERYTTAFLDDILALGIKPSHYLPKATEYIPSMIDLITRLLERNLAYIGSDQSIYFHIASFPNYGKLSHIHVDNQTTAHTGDEYDRDAVADFVLWKAYDPRRDGSVYFDSPFGKGRPGWHIECSAMAYSCLGTTLDLHMGGIDNMFPHHENEIAQSEGCFEAPFVRYWLHVEHLLVDSKKMSKSLGNFYTLRDLIHKGFTGREVRYLLASVHYRCSLNFTFESLEGARNALRRIDDCTGMLRSLTREQSSVSIVSLLERAHTAFDHALFDDFNISGALSALFDLIKESNCLQHQLSRSQGKAILDLIQHFDHVFQFCFASCQEIPQEIVQLANQRLLARTNKEWAAADVLRAEILHQGYLVEDTPDGFRIKHKP